MKTQGLANLYLPKRIAYHVKILIGGFFVTVFFNMIWKGTPIGKDFLFLYVMVLIQLEIFMVIASRIFRSTKVDSSRDYKRNIISRLLKFYLLVFIIALALLLMVIIIGAYIGDHSIKEVFDHFMDRELKPFLISWSIGIALGSLAFFYIEWTNGLKREQKLREEKLVFKYETLKNQVNPHFLFNSLNTLSSLVAKDATLSEKFIQKFSTIYRYILENNDVEMVELDRELNFVKDYFYLQQIRDEEKIQLNIDVEAANDFLILPISVQLLVENAFKHNAASKEEPLVVSIFIEDEYLVVKNNLRKKTMFSPTSKKGLNNLKERITLSMQKPMIVEEDQQSFVVKIPLKRKAS